MTRLSSAQWLIIGIAGIVLTLGIGWELPDAKRMSALLGGEALTERQKELLVSLRDEYFRKVTTGSDELARKFLSGERLDLKDFALPPQRGAGPIEYTEADRLNAFRSFVLRTAAMDEGKVYQALARMRPAQLDFDPMFYTYGGAYIYSVGAVLLVAKWAGLIQGATDLNSYLNDPTSVARLYMTGRAMNVALFLATLFLIGTLGNRLAGTRAGFLAMMTYGLSGVPLFQALVSKPHTLVAFFVMLSATLAVYHRQSRSWLSALASGAAAGMAAGATLPAAAAFVIPLALLWDGRNVRDSLFRIVGAGEAALLVWLATNPYAVLSWGRYGLNLLILMSPEGWNYGSFSPLTLGRYSRDLFLQSYCLLAAPFAVVGFIAAFRSGSTVAVRVATGSILLLLIVGMSPTEPRHLTFVGPLLCLFAGWGLDAAATRLFSRNSLVRRAAVAAVFVPGAFLAVLLLWYVISDEAWYEPTIRWIQEARIGPETSIGTFGTPHPNYMPPFPFWNARLMNLYKVSEEAAAPEYVVLGNSPAFNDRALWAEHPLRERYELAHVLGFRASYDWFPQWRVRDEARVAGWVYRRRDR